MFLWRSFFKFEASLKMDCTALALCTTGGQLAGEGLTLFLDVHKLDRHLALGRDVLRQDYLAIAAFAEHRADLVLVEERAVVELFAVKGDVEDVVVLHELDVFVKDLETLHVVQTGLFVFVLLVEIAARLLEDIN
jgi:hypothetical protein